MKPMYQSKLMQEMCFIILPHLMFLDKLAYVGAFEQWDFGDIHVEQREKSWIYDESWHTHLQFTCY